MKIAVIIPAYNEAAKISKVIEGIRGQQYPVVVVDDGSSDETAKIAEAKGAVVLTHSVNQGKGASLRKGFAYCLKQGFDALLLIDADGQHDPLDIPSFVRRAEESDQGLLIGNRMQDTCTMPWVRYLTNRFMSWLISSLIHRCVPDTQCGYRLIKKDALEKISLFTQNYEIESEMIFACARAGVKIGAVPIKAVYRNEKSRINPLIDTLRFIRFICNQASRKDCMNTGGRPNA